MRGLRGAPAGLPGVSAYGNGLLEAPGVARGQPAGVPGGLDGGGAVDGGVAVAGGAPQLIVYVGARAVAYDDPKVKDLWDNQGVLLLPEYQAWWDTCLTVQALQG